MSESNVFQREKIPFQMLGKQFNYEFIPSIHFQDVLMGVGNLLTSMSFEDGGLSVKDESFLPKVLVVIRDLFSSRVYQIISDVLQYQNNHLVSVASLKVSTRPLEVVEFLDILVSDPEILEALTALGKSLASVTEKLTGQSLTLNSMPSSPTTSDSSANTSTTA